MQGSVVNEARRQAEICNACRYCEGYCSVFPALQELREFGDADLVHLANLCHNCRGCYYACQYTAPHEFDLNLPKVLAELRQESWEQFAWPQSFARCFHRNGVGIALLLVLACVFVFAMVMVSPSSDGTGFYSVLPHDVMVAIFAPAFLLPLASVAVSLNRYWRSTGGGKVLPGHIVAACRSAAGMRNLAAGHGEGCNFEDRDRFSQARRYAHQLVLYGFLLCFASTSSGAILHYAFDSPAPYPLFSLPKILGISGGVGLGMGGVWMVALKLRADKALGDARIWGGEMGFVLLICLVALSGLALYGFGSLGTGVLTALLGLHLGSVLAFFLLLPFSKMVHGFYRLAALVRDAGSSSQGPGLGRE